MNEQRHAEGGVKSEAAERAKSASVAAKISGGEKRRENCADRRRNIENMAIDMKSQ